MEQTTEVTPSGQDTTANITFDENGEMQFSEAGLEGFKELLKEDVHDNTVRPTQEALNESEADSEPEPEPAPVKATPAESPKKKIKVDGQEIELTEEELIARAQQGEDYTRKMQRLAEERNALAPFEALITQLKTDPNLSQHIAKYWQPQQPAVPQKPQFDDPIEQLKWETEQSTLAKVEQLLQQRIVPLQQTQAAQARQQGLNEVKAAVQADPDYKVVHQAIIDMVASMPSAIQKNVYLQLDQDPTSYLEAFKVHKEKLAASRTAAPTTTGKSAEPKRTERAPILESSNSAPTEEGLKSQRVKIDKAKARALREGSVDALQNLLETGGFLEHLV